MIAQEVVPQCLSTYPTTLLYTGTDARKSNLRTPRRDRFEAALEVSGGMCCEIRETPSSATTSRFL